MINLQAQTLTSPYGFGHRSSGSHANKFTCI